MSIPPRLFVDMVSGCTGHRRRTKGTAMSSVATSRHVTAERLPWLTGTLTRTTVSVGVLAAAVTSIGAVGLRAAGVPLAVHGKIPLASFALITFVAAVIGGGARRLAQPA